MVSCSESVVENGGNLGNANGKGYINLAINLPTQPNTMTRGLNDVLDDGDPTEYQINQAKLLLFVGKNESSATFVNKYDIPTTGWNQDVDNDHITTQLAKVIEIDGVNAENSDKIYALVVLNGDDQIKSITTGQNFDTYFKNVKADLSQGTAPYMSNAILAANPGKTTENATANRNAGVTALVNIKDKIYDTQAEASSNPAAEIFVERGCAKVTVGQNWSSDNIVGEGDNELTATLIGFELANANKESFLMRHWTSNDWFGLYSQNEGTSYAGYTSNRYRFAGTVQIGDNNITGIQPIAGTYYRTYWGEDVNYGTAANPATDYKSVETTYNTNAKYCNENTFDVERQKIQNTTCAMVKVTFQLKDHANGSTFYIQGDNKSIIYDLKAVKTKIANAALAYMPKTWTGTINPYEEGVSLGTRNTTTGVQTAATIKLKNGDETYDLTTEEVAAINASLVFTCYENGAAYYKIPIKHFGEELTPWSATGKTEAYPTTNRDANYLGRYGVLRNNWYDVTVTSVKALGCAIPEDVTKDGHWDDEIKKYLSVKINVLSWAKRTQGAVLQ